MKFEEKLNQLGLRLRFNLGILSAEWTPQQGDRLAAWKMYIELLTRITTQALPNEVGNEKAALKSIYSIFDSTRSVLKEQGPNCIEFSKIAIGVLNQVVRPFTTKWHNKGLAGAFECETECKNFRKEYEARKSIENTGVPCAPYELGSRNAFVHSYISGLTVQE